MSRKAVVLSAEAEKLSVLPISKLECASCSSSCGKKQEAVSVSNPHNFPLHTGELVFIEVSARRQAFEGLFSLLFPFCSALLGYFVSGFVAPHFDGRAADGVRALFVLLFLFLSSAVVLFVTRLFPPAGNAEIVAVSESGFSPHFSSGGGEGR